MSLRQISAPDLALQTFSDGLRTLLAPAQALATRQAPLAALPSPDAEPLSEAERRLSGALMRVNHVGEVCAQALYQGQSLGTDSPELRLSLQAALHEEQDHLAWCEERLTALGAHQSVLNPLWYAGAFALGFVAAKAGDARSLGFVVETEHQVEAHLAGHLTRLPAADTASRAVVTQMMQDEAAHARDAQEQGAIAVPAPVAALMRLSAKVMTRVAHYV
jgi:3-demethoxyubiquinol 3-hydroxylase